MLIKTTPQLKENEIAGLKLVTGEEIICKVLSVNDKEIVVQAPLHLMQGPQGVAFVPIIGMAEPKSDLVLYKANVVGFFDPDKQYKSAYSTAISDIILPMEKKILA